MRLFFWPLLILSIITSAAACADEGDEGDGGGADAEVRVVTSLPLFADFASSVGGDRVAVTALLPSGADPHTYEPSPRDVARLSQADVVFVNGLGLEPAVIRLVEANLSAGVPLVELAEEAIAAGAVVHEGDDHGGDDGHEHDEGDPHLWMSVDNALLYAAVIRDRLSEVDPAGVAEYAANYDAYASALQDVGAELLEKAGAVPEEHRKLITTHDAFGYFADYIGFEIEAFVAAGPGQDTSPDQIASIISAIEESGIPAVFTEPQISSESETLEQAAADAGADVCKLYSDSLDDEVKGYLDLMRFNAAEIARCLGAA